MSNLRQLKVTFDSFDEMVESIGPGLSRTHLFARTDEEIAAGTRVRLEIGTAGQGALIRGVAKVTGPGDVAAEQGLHLHLIHLDPSSTRRVDAIVRGEIADVEAVESRGPSPFDIPSADPKPHPDPPENAHPEPGALRATTHLAADTESDPSTEPEHRSPLRVFAWPLALLAVIFLLWLAWTTNREPDHQPDRQTGTVEPSSAEPEEPTSLAAEILAEPSTAPPSSTESSPSTGPEQSTVEIAQTADEPPPVADTVRAWADAWSRQDPDAYIELYAPGYHPPELDHESWVRQRRARIAAPERLEVRVSDLEVTMPGPDRAIARFHQLYITEDKTLAARKLLELEHSASGWRIVAERVDQSPSVEP